MKQSTFNETFPWTQFVFLVGRQQHGGLCNYVILIIIDYFDYKLLSGLDKKMFFWTTKDSGINPMKKIKS